MNYLQVLGNKGGMSQFSGVKGNQNQMELCYEPV
jgi:hypothetical protein